VKALVLIGIIAVTIVEAEATGWFGPMVYLDQGGRNVDASPEFYWDLELKRIARDFNAPEKLFQRPLKSADLCQYNWNCNQHTSASILPFPGH
jgi:hypothetical protein